MARRKAASKPEVVFEQVISGKEGIKQRWPELSRVAADRDKLVAAFDAAQREPMWKNDPRLARVSKSTARQTLDFYNKVVADGRYLRELHTDPAAAARKLKIKASPKVLGVMSAIGSGLATRGKKANPGLVVVGGSIVVVGLAITAAVTAFRHDPKERILVDESGFVKLGSDKGKSKPGRGKSKSKSKRKKKKPK